MYTESQKAQMKLNGTPDATRDTSAADESTRRLNEYMAQLEAERNRSNTTLEALATVIAVTGGVE
jgi:hypothetical protein